MKTCTTCGVAKPATLEYFRDYTGRNTLRAECRECANRRARERRKAKPPREKPPQNSQDVARRQWSILNLEWNTERNRPKYYWEYDE